jgi:hypothetical protein
LFATPLENDSARADGVLARLEAVDVDNTTPRQALELLAELKSLLRDL